MRISSRSQIIVLAAAWALVGVSRPSPADDVGSLPPPPIFAATGYEPPDLAARQPGQTHLWVVRQKGGGAFSLLHRTSRSPAGELYPAFEGAGSPIAVAAQSDRLYLFFKSGLQTIQFMEFGEQLPPRYDATQLPALPSEAKLLRAAGVYDGPIALVQDKQASGEDRSPLKLLRLRGPKWIGEALPPEIAADNVLDLVVLDENSGSVAVIERRPNDDDLIVHRLGPVPADQRLPVPPGPDARFLAVRQNSGSHLLMVRRPPSGDRLDIRVLREAVANELLPIDLAITGGRWWALGTYGEWIVLTADEKERLSLSRVAFPGGDASDWVPLDEVKPSMPVNPTLVLNVAMVVVAMLFLLLTGKRDGVADQPDLPSGVRLAGLNRVAAAAVDFAPALAVSMVAFGLGNPLDVIGRSPVFAPTTLHDWLPALTAFALHVGHTSLTEVFTASTLGKAICGCRVTNLRGEPPHVWQVLARNAFKLVEMLFPPFLVWPILFQHGQRLGDLVARTLVISTLPPRGREEDLEEPVDSIDDTGGPGL